MIDSTLKGLIEIHNFENGRCLIRKRLKNRKRKFGYIDTKGQLVIPAVFDLASDFSNALAWVDSLDFKDYQPGLNLPIPKIRGLIDTNGQFIIPYRYKNISSFNEAGFAEVVDSHSSKRGLINLQGKLVNDQLYTRFKRFQQGYAFYQKGVWKLKEYAGNEIKLPTRGVADLKYFSNGHIWVKDTLGYWNHVSVNDGDSKLVKSGFQKISPFSKHYSLVKLKGTSLLYGQDQSQIKPTDNESFIFWSESLIGVKTDQGQYYLNTGRQNIYHRNFEEISHFKNQIAKVTFKGSVGIIKRNGIYIIPPKFKNVAIRKDGHILVQPLQIHVGLFDKKGKVIVPVKYDHLEILDSEIIKVELADQVGYYSVNGSPIWKLND